ncbi:hypothetical protein QGP82_21980 [Leptothoe sp. LEGE 181152]|nr:hypothetical protein [Leptothoe sp. LEGE 181152]
MDTSTFRTSPIAQFAKRKIGKLLCTPSKSFVFVATTGRSGSKTLYELCRTIPSCAAFHEPIPKMNADVLHDFNGYREQKMWFYFKDFKLPAIYKASIQKKWYIETNHAFIKCFADAAVKEFGNRLKVIHLVRDRHEVAKSFLYRGSIPGKKCKRGDWVLEPYAPRNIIRFDKLELQNPNFKHPYLKCLWYWYEIEARTRQFIRLNPNVLIYKLRTEDLNNLEILIPAFEEIFEGFDRQTLIQKVGVRANKSQLKPKFPDDISKSLIKDFDLACEEQLEMLSSVF